jgi:hypothetical protein
LISVGYSAIDERVWEYLCTFSILLISIINPEILDIFMHMLDWFKETWQQRQTAWQGRLFDVVQEHFTIGPVKPNWHSYASDNSSIRISFEFQLNSQDDLNVLPTRAQINNILAKEFSRFPGYRYTQADKNRYLFDVGKNTIAADLKFLSQNIGAAIEQLIIANAQTKNIIFSQATGTVDVDTAQHVYAASWEAGEVPNSTVVTPEKSNASSPSKAVSSLRKGLRVMQASSPQRIAGNPLEYLLKHQQSIVTSSPSVARYTWEILPVIKKFFHESSVILSTSSEPGRIIANVNHSFAMIADNIIRMNDITDEHVSQLRSKELTRLLEKKHGEATGINIVHANFGSHNLQMYELKYGDDDHRLYGVALPPTGSNKNNFLIVFCLLGRSLHGGRARVEQLLINIKNEIGKDKAVLSMFNL